MINCSKCNELIGDNASECTFCKHIITDEERRMALRNNEKLHEEAVAQTMEEYSSRVKSEMIICATMLLTAIVGMMLIAMFDLSSVYGIILFVFVVLIYVFGVLKLHIGLCPYCESFMGRGLLYRNHCPRCGGRLH